MYASSVWSKSKGRKAYWVQSAWQPRRHLGQPADALSGMSVIRCAPAHCHWRWPALQALPWCAWCGGLPLAAAVRYLHSTAVSQFTHPRCFLREILAGTRALGELHTYCQIHQLCHACAVQQAFGAFKRSDDLTSGIAVLRRKGAAAGR